MERKAVSGIMLTLLLTSMLTLAFNVQPVKTEPTTIVVPDNYPTIQKAINAAKPGDTIFCSGTYYEHVVVNKTVSLMGENKTSTIIDGSGTDTVVFVTANNVNINGFTIQNGHCGIHLWHSGGHNISDNIISNNSWLGIHLELSTGNAIMGNIVKNNRLDGIRMEHSNGNIVKGIMIANNTRHGIWLWDSNENIIFGNTVASNGQVGIALDHSAENTLKNNNMTANSHNFALLFSRYPMVVADFIQDIDASNTVDGKTLYYWVNQANRQVPSNAGYVAIVNSTNIVVRGLNLTRNGQGVLFAYTTNSTIETVNASENIDGVFLWASNYNNIKNNVLENGLDGISIESSDNNILSNNKASNNTNAGILGGHSSYNILSFNTASTNYYGIVLRVGSNSNLISKNIVINNTVGIQLEGFCYNNIINGNTVADNRENGLILNTYITNNTIYHNNFITNTYQISLSLESFNNTWDNGYEGNYWSDYNGTDTTIPPDGIGDTFLPWQGVDYYPLMNPFWNPADINHDLIVDIDDVIIPALAFGSYQGHPRWSTKADLNSDGIVDIDDMIIVAINFGKICSKDLLNPCTPTIHFDRNVYYPNAEAFWKPDVLVPIGVKVVDYNVDLNFVKVRISSSVDSKEITLAKVDSGVFIGTVFALGLRLGEPISNTSSFNVRYGDVIIAQYLDTFKSSISTAGALFGFPEYVLDKEFVSLDPWKLFDSDGVPLVNYTPPTGIQYNPVTVCQYAFANYHMYVTTRYSKFREKFLVQANWLVKTVTQKGNFSVWEYKFDWPSYGLTNPFVSAMAQGHGLSVLTRAYVLRGNTTYLEVAEKAMRSFEVEMDSGGVRYTDSDGVWYEEGADVGAPSSKVLNGFIFALFGLYEYSFLTNSSKGYKLFWEGTHTLSANLYRYDTGSWSYYDLLYYRPASLGYHKLHIDQLRTMYELTSLEIFLYYSNKFQSYIH